MKKAKKMKCYKRLIHKQSLQVSGLCGPPFLSYLPKRLTQLCRALYGVAMLVYHFGTPIWRLHTKLKLQKIIRRDLFSTRQFCRGHYLGVTQSENSEIQNVVFSKRKTPRDSKAINRFISSSSSTWSR